MEIAVMEKTYTAEQYLEEERKKLQEQLDRAKFDLKLLQTRGIPRSLEDQLASRQDAAQAPRGRRVDRRALRATRSGHRPSGR